MVVTEENVGESYVTEARPTTGWAVPRSLAFILVTLGNSWVLLSIRMTFGS